MSTTYAYPSQAAVESPSRIARMTGVLWLACILTSMVGPMLSMPAMGRGDAAATAANILANETRFRLGSIVTLVSGMTYLGATALLYCLLKPVNRALSLTAAYFGVIGVALGALSAISSFAALSLLRSGHVTGLTASQLQEVAALAIRLPMGAFFAVAMIFFGVQCFIAGDLIRNSTFLPPTLGVLLGLGGATYVIVACVNLTAPWMISNVMPFVGPAALVGEGSLTVWLLARGVNAQRWKALASAA